MYLNAASVCGEHVNITWRWIILTPLILVRYPHVCYSSEAFVFLYVFLFNDSKCCWLGILYQSHRVVGHCYHATVRNHFFSQIQFMLVFLCFHICNLHKSKWLCKHFFKLGRHCDTLHSMVNISNALLVWLFVFLTCSMSCTGWRY